MRAVQIKAVSDTEARLIWEPAQRSLSTPAPLVAHCEIDTASEVREGLPTSTPNTKKSHLWRHIVGSTARDIPEC